MSFNSAQYVSQLGSNFSISFSKKGRSFSRHLFLTLLDRTYLNRSKSRQKFMKHEYITNLNLTLRVYFLYKHYKNLLKTFEITRNSFLFFLFNFSTEVVLGSKKVVNSDFISKLSTSFYTPISVNIFNKNIKKKTFLNKSVFTVTDTFFHNLFSLRFSPKNFRFLKKLLKQRIKLIRKYSPKAFSSKFKKTTKHKKTRFIFDII
jgi:hypothetical protein